MLWKGSPLRSRVLRSAHPSQCHRLSARQQASEKDTPQRGTPRSPGQRQPFYPLPCLLSTRAAMATMCPRLGLGTSRESSVKCRGYDDSHHMDEKGTSEEGRMVSDDVVDTTIHSVQNTFSREFKTCYRYSEYTPVHRRARHTRIRC